MSRQEPLKGVPREVKTAARLALNPSKIAKQLGEFEDVLALPRFAHQVAEAEPLDDLTRARELVEAIKVELSQMKRPRYGESETEAHERKWRGEVIDATYALTPKWQAYRNIMDRRRQLIGKECGSVRSHTDGIEREIHDELAIRLSRDPRQYRGLQMLQEAKELAWAISSAAPSTMPPEEAQRSDRLKSLLLDLVQLMPAIEVCHRLVILLVADHEKRGALDNTPREIELFPGRPVRTANAWVDVAQTSFTVRWPRFNQRDLSLLRTAINRSKAELDPFLEYLESRERGRALLTAWCQWSVATDVKAIHYAYDMASYVLGRGACPELLDEVEETGGLSEERFDEGFNYLCEIGAVLVPSSDDAPIALRYRFESDRKQNTIPDGWKVMPSDDQFDAELDKEGDEGSLTSEPNAG